MSEIELLNKKIQEHKNDKKILEIEKVLKKILQINSNEKKLEENELINIIGNNHCGVFYYEYIWVIKFLIEIFENYKNNKYRKIWIYSELNNLCYFEMSFDNFEIEKNDKEKFEKLEKDIKKKLYKYSD